jgi:hypothetical protein
MTTTAVHYRVLKELEAICAYQGFELQSSEVFGTPSLALIAKYDCLPIYTRNTELARGTAEELRSFLWGWHKAKEYFSILRLVDDKKISRAEQDHRNRLLADMIKHGKKKDESK